MRAARPRGVAFAGMNPFTAKANAFGASEPRDPKVGKKKTDGLLAFKNLGQEGKRGGNTKKSSVTDACRGKSLLHR